MKSKVKYIWLALLIVILAAVLYGYREYTRKAADLSDVKSQANISADNLVLTFQNDELKANLLYLGKPIEVKGTIAELNNQQDTIVNIILGKKNEMHRVSCLINKSYIGEIKTYKVGDRIALRGICNGFLMDVELNRCVVIK
jgi:hypothetical protein